MTFGGYLASTTPVLSVRFLFLFGRHCFEYERIMWLTGDFFGIITSVRLDWILWKNIWSLNASPKGSHVQIFFLLELMCISERSKSIQRVKSAASMLNLLLIFCRNVHLQETCGHYAEAKYRNSRMMLRSFSSSSAAYWTSSHAWNLNGGLWSVGQYVMLGIDFT